MKTLNLNKLSLLFLFFLTIRSLSAQVLEEPGRKFPPYNPPESQNSNVLNTDAPAGSISVAENALYNSYNPQQLVQNVLVTGCLTANNVRFGYYEHHSHHWHWHNHNWPSNAGNRQMAYFSKGSSSFPLDEGIILTTGRASSAMGPNNTGSRSDQMEEDASDPDLANITNRTMKDAAVLEFDFIPAGNTVEFTYIFTSEEYLEYCETQYNDAFGFFLSGPGINGPFTNNAVNLATIPNNIPVSINTIHPAGTNINNHYFPAENAQYYSNNPNGSLTMQFDGGTVVLTALYTVTPCLTYRIKMAIADASDQKWDAGVFLGARSFNSESLNITNFGNFIQDQNDVFEGCNNFFRVERDSADLSQALSVNLIVSGSCTNGVDIQTTGNQPFPASVTIPANAAYIDIPYIAVSDGIQDNGETLVISVATSCPCSPLVQYITRTIHIYEQFIINSVSAINAQCNGQNDGAITIQVSGGSGNYLYSIDSGTSWQSLNNFTGLAPGNYTILVQDPGSCYPYDSVSVTIGSPSPLVANAGPDVVICAGTSTQLNGSGGIQYSWSPSTGLNFNNIANPIASPSVTTTYTLTVTNAQGQCSSTDEVTVFVNPGPTPPAQLSVDRTISCADDSGNIQLTAIGGAGDSLYWFANSCGGVSIGTGTTLVLPSPEITTTYFAWWESPCGHSLCAQITVHVPLPISLGDLTITGVSCSELNNGRIVLNATGGVQPYTYTISPLAGLQSPPGTFTGLSAQAYTITVIDANGCIASTNAIVPVSGDTTDPTVVNCPEPITLPADTNCLALVPDLREAVIASDNCSSISNLVITQVPGPGTSVSRGITPITLTITDEAGNSAVCNTSLTVADLTAPVIEKCSDSVVQYAGTNCLGEIPDFRTDLEVIDNCTPILSLDITQIPAPGTIVTSGLTLVELTVVDEAGNANGCTALFYVLDTISPYIINCPEPVNIILENSCTAIVPDFTTTLSVTDNCTEINEINISQVPAAGSIVSAGTTQVTISATDGAGNTTICVCIITVSDNQAPVISGPADITVNADPGLCSASMVNLGYPTASDNCGIPTVTNNAPQIFPVGNTEVTWTATDSSGLTATSTQIITVIDNEPPVIICPPGIVTVPDPGQNYASGIDTGLPQTSDNCAVDTVFNNAPAQYPVGITWVIWTVTDIHGLSTTCLQSVIVIDDIEPVVMCPPLIQVECIGEIPAPYPNFAAFVAAGGSATDNDGIDSSSFILVSQTSNSLNCPESVSRVYAVADNYGNYNFCTQNIIVDDITQPVITVPVDIIVECSEIPEPGMATATDNCDTEVTITFEGETLVPGTCPDSYTLSRTWKAVDNCGNEATASQVITVQDVTPPLLTIPADITVECSEVTTAGIATATDNCDAEVTVTFEGEVITPGSCADSYVLTRTWKAVDNCGNEATASQVITVQDITSPVLTIPADITVECSEVPATGTATATDNCDTDVTVTFEGEIQTPGSCPDSYTLTRTWKAVDNCGNEATASQTITVQDITDPVLTVPADITVECTDIPAVGTATATDNCDTEVTLTYEGELLVPGSCPDSYTLIRTWNAVDNCGNEATASQTITVQDVTPPVLTIPADLAAECSEIPAAGMATATDNCDSEVTVVFEGETTTPGSCPDSYTLTRTWKATDNCGNEATASQIITVQDVTPPVITIPADITVECSEIPEPGLATATDNCDAEVTITFEGEILVPGTCPDSYTLSRTWKAVDNCGNEATASQVITVQDLTPPVLTIPADITIECSEVPAAGTATATDNCDAEVTVTFEGEVITPGSCADSYVLTRTWKAVDNCGNEATASQVITVQDVTPPVLTIPADITVECSEVPATGTATATDNCDTDVTVTFEGEIQTSGSCPDSYTLTRTWKAVDNCGNEATASQTITVQDITDPVLTVPADITVECTDIPAVGTATATDNCDTEVTLTYEGELLVPGSCPDSYTLVRTWNAVDNCGNNATASQTITVQDVTPPVLTIPADLTAECSEIPAAGIATATDNCDTEVTIILVGEVITPGSCPDSYTLTRTWKATDNCGNEATASQIITVQDVTPPVITIPADITVECSEIPEPGMATATDNCDTEVTITFEGEILVPGTCHNSYTLSRTWKAVDNCWNEATASQVITVQDITPPVLTIPADITVECSEVPATGTATATDNCDAEVTVTFEGEVITPGSCADSYVLTRTWKAVDNCGNEATASQVITVQDVTPPVLTIPADITVECSEVPATGTATATDNCDTDVAVTFEGEIQTPGSCPDSYTLTRTWKAVDNCGNEATASQVITVLDITDPVIIIPADITVECTDIPAVGTATATDNCDTEVTLTYEGELLVPGSCPDSYTLVRTWKAVDNCGNNATASQTITVQDVTPPVLTIPADLTAECSEIPAAGIATATDNCDSEVTVVFEGETTTPGSCPDSYTLTRTWKATDNCGNEATASQSITVQDVTPPVITIPADITVECSEIPGPGLATATDNCDTEVTITFEGETLVPGTCHNSYTLSRTWKAVDNCGNEATASQVITVQDITSPVLTIPADITVECSEVPATGTATATDNCDAEVTVTFEGEVITPGSCADSYVLTRTWKAVDNCGNEATASQVITVQDVTPPVLTIPADITVECSEVPATGTATATDNCDTDVAVTFEGEIQTSGSCPDSYTLTRTWKAVDNCGNEATASQTITVQDITDPVLTIPADITVECTDIPAVGTATATDNCDTEVTLTYEGELLVPGSCPDSYTLVRTWNAVDNCGNNATASQTITVQDVTPPVLTIPADLTAECSEIPAAGIATATDNCDTDVTVVFEGETTTPGSCPDSYTLTRTWKATDNCGNEATASQIITVQDVTPPVITIPADITVECSEVPAAGTATATDNCDAEVTVTFEGEVITPGSCADSYILTRTWKAVDNCGNEATASQVITVQDITSPVLTIPADITVECSEVPATGTATATDNCDAEVTVTFEGEVITPGSCADSYVLTRTWKAVDNCGNEATASQVITVQDVTPPVLIIPADITVECSEVPATGTATATDNCDTDVTVTFEGEIQTSGSCPDSYTLTRTWKAVDNCGNEATASQTITVQDITPPAISNPASDLTVQCTGSGNLASYQNWLSSQGGAVATDNCGSVIWSSDTTSISYPCANTMSVTITFTASDDCNNASTTIATFSVIDTIAPVLTCPSDIILANDPGLCSAFVIVPIPEYIEDCSQVTLINSFNGTSDASGNYPVGITPVTWTATDGCGNSDTCIMNITVQDLEIPTINCPADVSHCQGETVVLGVPEFDDNCEIASVVNNAPATFPAGTTQVTWTVTDISGNSNSCVQLVNVFPSATVSAGPDELICEGNTGYTITGASANNYLSVLWTSSGNGTLLNAGTLTPTYIPSLNETGNIYLTITAMGNPPCGEVTDQMLLTIIPGPVANAGPDDVICEGGSFLVSGSSAGYFTSLVWTSSGTGSFDNPSLIHPTYHPSDTDLLAGSVVLTLSVNGSAPCTGTNDMMTLEFEKAAIADAGADTAICQGTVFTVTTASAFNYQSLQWTHTGTGSLSGSNTIAPIYTPGINETGVVTLKLIANGNEPCGDAEDEMLLTIHGSPSVYAGADDLSCDNSPYLLSTSQANNYSVLQWYSSGTGSFSDATLLHPVYTPSSADVAAGSVNLTLSLQGLPPCDSVIDNLVLSFVHRVDVFAGNDTLTCNNQPVTIISSDIQNSTAISWTHNGNGSIENGQTANPTYVPGTSEAGYVTLVVTATGLAPCPAATDSLVIEIVPAAEIFAGPDLTGCDGQPVNISLATASHVTSYLWKTSGNGTFDDPSLLHPVYTPGTEDQSLGSVLLTLEGAGTYPCTAVMDQLTLTILQGPRVNAGVDQIQCNSASFVLGGATATNYGDLLWTHNGSGTLSNETTLTPTYTPSAGETGVVTFTITIQGNQYCGSISASDQVLVTLGNPIIANAGPDQLIPLGASTTLQGSVTGGSGFNACSWEPSGLLINPNNFNTATTALTSNTLFVLTVVDLSTSCSDSDTVIITMGAANQPPVATIDQDTASVTLPAIIPVLLNDTDPDGTIEEISILTPPSFGTAVLNEDNTITYAPVPGYEGFDTLVYQICDNGMPILCDTALVVIRVFGERPFDDIIIYNYLTPNGDNHNDVWTIDNIQFWPENTVLIFNRWGDRIRTFAHYDNVSTVWDGTNEQGDRLPDGTYYYIVKVTHMDPFSGTLKEDAKTGYVMIKSNRK